MASILNFSRLMTPVLRRARSALLASVCAAALLPGAAHAISLKSAIKIAVESNPEVGEAIANREAQEFELEQAKGLYLPKADAEARYGRQDYSSPGTRAAGTDDWHDRREVRGIITQRLFDGHDRRGERYHQAARVDSASHRINERAETVSLNVVREYITVGRRIDVVRYADDNIAYHQRILSDLKEGQTSGSISVADSQQAEERLYSAQARQIELTEDLNSAKIRFYKAVGKPLDSFQQPGSIEALLPKTLSEAIGIARKGNPIILAEKADIDAARAMIIKARSEYYPKLDLELTGRQGHDLDGVLGRETEWRAELVMRWNIFKGGIDRANVQEQVRVTDEERQGLRKAHREVEESVRLAWERMVQQRRRYARLRDQLASSERLIESYSEQFKVGDRSLLDLLDTQNTRFNTQLGVEVARGALEFAQYRVLAAAGMLLNALNIEAPTKSVPYAEAEHGVPDTPDGETERRYTPRTGWYTRRSR